MAGNNLARLVYNDRRRPTELPNAVSDLLDLPIGMRVRGFLLVGRSLSTGVMTIWRLVISAPMLVIEASYISHILLLSATLLQLELWQQGGVNRARAKLQLTEGGFARRALDQLAVVECVGRRRTTGRILHLLKVLDIFSTDTSSRSLKVSMMKCCNTLSEGTLKPFSR